MSSCLERNIKAKELFVEIFDTAYGTEAMCGICGSSVEHEECPDCEDGYSYHDCGEDTCCCLDPEPNVPCDTCDGHGGWWRCECCKTTTYKAKRSVKHET